MHQAVARSGVAAVLAATWIALSAPGSALALNCFTQSVTEKLAGADIAFVGRVKSVERVPGSGIEIFAYRFQVDHAVKGTLGKEVTLRAAQLRDIDNQIVTPAVHVAIGVLGTRGRGGYVTSTCSLVDPGALMGASDQPKGGAIKVVIGLVILALVLAYSVRRLRRRQALQG